MKYHNKEMSWLSFNARVLQEARDPSNPLSERIKFLGIYSSNLDEFFQVRVANLKRMALLGRHTEHGSPDDPSEILKKVQMEYYRQRTEFENLCQSVFRELENHRIFLLRAENLNPSQKEFISDYFKREVRPNIFPIMLPTRYKFPELRDEALYLTAELHRHDIDLGVHYCLVEIPTNVLPRFVALPSPDGEKHFMLIDEVVRFGLKSIFTVHNYTGFKAYNIKITRDALFDLDDDISLSYLDKIDRGLQQRREGDLIRFIYDREMPEDMLRLFKKKIGLHKLDTVSPGGRYHHFKDFMDFPKIAGLPRPAVNPPLDHPEIDKTREIMHSLRNRDILLYFPYHSFLTVIDLVREASIDPHVQSIQVTVYRVAPNSSLINALINARKNRKDVVVLLELQARFDEKNNILWANALQEEGVKVIFGVMGLKVHSKLCLITSRRGGKMVRYACVGSGNMNEDTARIYTDCLLMTTSPEITEEVSRIFDFFQSHYRLSSFQHLIVSPFSFREKMTALINNEIKLVREGKKGSIDIKMNNLADWPLTDKLYEAALAGVKIRIICRGRFFPVIDQPDFHGRLEAVSIVDKYLEHARFFIFHNNGNDHAYIGSADWQERNIDRRIEVTCPIYRKKNVKILKDIFEIQWKDNCKARILDNDLSNRYRQRTEREPLIRSQDEIYTYLKNVPYQEVKP